MKFGFGFVPRMPIDDSLKVVQRGEELGFDMIWIPDQTFYRDPFLIMGVWAAHTTSVEFMIGVTNPYTRHPAQVARTIATVDEISGGRVNLGIGAGNRRELLLPMGYEQTSAANRCRDMTTIVRALLHGETVEYRSDYFVADGIKLSWQLTRPDIPIYIAARGALTLAVAGEVADGAVVGALVSPDGLDYAFNAIQSGAQKSNRQVSDIATVSWVTCRVTDDWDSVEPGLKRSVAHIIGGAPIPLLKAIGLDEDYISAIKATYHEGGQEAAAEHVTEHEIDMLTIVGSADKVTRKIKALEKRGVGQVGVLLTESDADSCIEVIERLAHDVMPQFR